MYKAETGGVLKTRQVRRQAIAAIAAAGLLAPFAAQATDGYFSHGYGMKSLGMGGASVARTDDTFGGANNPAQMVWVGNRMDVGVSFFGPDRSAQRSGGTNPGMNGSTSSSSDSFYIPEFGFNHLYRPDLSFGVSVYGNGGMNTNYPQDNFNCGRGPSNILCGAGGVGVDLQQLIVAPTISWKITPSQSIGISPLLAEQRFKAWGLDAFSQMSTNPSALTGTGYNYSFGAGVRVGYLWEASPMFAVGATYASKISAVSFHNYSGLFAGAGSFDIPANFSVGIRVTPVQQWTVLADAERIQYANVASIANPSANILQCAGGNASYCLGGPNGAGFGWNNITVLKIGVEFTAEPNLILRAGYNHSQNPISPSDVTFNILAPGVVQNQYTIGATYDVDKSNEITFAAAYMPRNTVTGPSLFNSFGYTSGANETIGLSEKVFGIAWGKKF